MTDERVKFGVAIRVPPGVVADDPWELAYKVTTNILRRLRVGNPGDVDLSTLRVTFEPDEVAPGGVVARGSVVIVQRPLL